MLEALQIAATGLQARQLHVDTIAHNLVNAATPGFKRSRVAFHDLVTRAATAPDGVSASAATATESARPGVGVGVATISRQFESGDLRRTGAALDLAVAGDGLIEVALPDGGRAYTRGGTLIVNGDGMLAVGGGQPLAGSIAIPEAMQQLVIDPDGRVQATLPGQSRPVELGQLTMVRFMSPQGLSAGSDGLYRATEQSGEPIAGRPGEDSFGVFRQAHLEASNVRMVDEIVELMAAQRSYEASVNVVRAADEMLALVNNLRR